MKFLHLLIILSVCLIFNSCSNKIEFADYEENASVFAMLDPTQPVQYVKINKVFTSPGQPSANVAKIADSLFFDSLTPTLTEVETGRVIPLYKTNTILKQPGIFTTYPNYLYSTNEKIYAANPAKQSEYYHYRLDLILPKKQKHITAITDIPDSIIIGSPYSLISTTNPTIDFYTSSNFRVIFRAPNNSAAYDAFFYFNYLEVNKADTFIKTIRTLKFSLLSNYMREDIPNQGPSVSHESSSFYDFLLNQLKVDNTVERRFLPCRLELTCANIIYGSYLQANEPFIGIVQKQKEYSNIENGIGLFASRRLSSYNNITLGATTKNNLIGLPQFKVFGFVN